MRFRAIQALVPELIELAQTAGDMIMAIYKRRDEMAIDIKEDQTPVTKADHLASELIVNRLKEITPKVPVVSEEGPLQSFAQRQLWRCCWMVDPLDGTKEFLDGNGEFTVNIAFIDRTIPVLSIVYVPVTGVAYVATPREQAYRLVNGEIEPLRTRSLAARLEAGEPLTVVASRRHGADQVTALCARIQEKFAPIKLVNAGSSLKLCMIAAGEADIYPRFGNTHHWDVAAAQAVVQMAGGEVMDMGLQPMRYLQTPDLLNEGFYAVGSDVDMWRALLTSLRR